MKAIESAYAKAKAAYDDESKSITDVLDLIKETVIACLKKLNSNSIEDLKDKCDSKSYSVYVSKGGGATELSRPFRKDIFISNERAFIAAWDLLKSKSNVGVNCYNIDHSELNKTIYTAIMAFSMCFDIWKRGSRKTPGTFYEVVLGTVIFRALDGYERSKHIKLQGVADADDASKACERGVPYKEDGESKDDSDDSEVEGSVSTDIVFTKKGKRGGVVVPAKITTRERVVQPFAHQRILDSVFGVKVYKSVLACVSEIQLDKKATPAKAKAICVPGTIILFQEHLAAMAAIVYLDPPARYQAEDVTKKIPVITVGELLTGKLAGIF